MTSCQRTSIRRSTRTAAALSRSAKLKEENERLQAQLREVEQEMQRARRDISEYAPLFYSHSRKRSPFTAFPLFNWLPLVAPLIASGILFLWYYLEPETWDWKALIAVPAMGGVTLLLRWFAQWSLERKLRRPVYPDRFAHYERSMGEPPFREMVLHFAEMTTAWPPSVREELTYLLSTEVVRMPPDVGARYVTEFAIRSGLPPHQVRNLTQWADVHLKMIPSERRILAEQVRRLVL